MKGIVDIVVQMIYYIHLNTINYLQFMKQLKEIEDDFNELLFLANVLCLSHGRVFKDMEFLTPIQDFQNKGILVKYSIIKDRK